MDRTADRIVPLDQLKDFKVAEGDPDVRGWDVLTSDGRRVGEVDNLLVDRTAMKVRYLDVDLDGDLIEGDRDRHILVPIGYARLDEDDDRIFVDGLTSATLNQIPAYDAGSLTREYETGLHSYFDNGFTGTGTETDFYAHQSYDETQFFSPRRMQGESRVPRSEEQLAVGNRERSARADEIDREGDVDVREQR